MPGKRRIPTEVTVSGILNSCGMNQPQGIQSHTAGADVHTEDLTRKDLEDTVLL